MPENLKHTSKTRGSRKRNGTFIGGYVNDHVAEFVRSEARKNGKTLSHYLNLHFQTLLNDYGKPKENKSTNTK